MKKGLQDDLSKHTQAYVNHTVEELKRLRYWFAGFEAAGGKLPVCEQSISTLRKAQILLEEYESLINKYK